MRMTIGMLALAGFAATTPAMAQEARELCADRPGLGTPACTVDPGHLQAEIGLGDWTLDRQPDSRTDSIRVGQIGLRYGIGETTELRFGWDAYGHDRMRDRVTGAIDRTSGVGDVTVGLKQNLANPDGSGFSIALLPYATLPAGHSTIGEGDWAAGLIVPVTYELSDSITLELTPEVDAAVDEDRSGRHLAYSSVAGVQAKLGEKAGVTAELQAIRDRDPGGHETMLLSGLSFAYQPQDQTQLDIGAYAGLNHQTPDIEISFGITRKF